MDHASSVLLSRIDQLENLVHVLESRILALEGDTSTSPVVTAREEDDAAAVAVVSPKGVRQPALPLIGQSLLILGVAFLLRWLTESGTLPPAAGTAFGLAYAGFWIVVAGRAAAHGNKVSPAYRGLAASLIAFPLVWEATIKFGFLPAAFGALALFVMISCSLFVAWRWEVRALAWTLVLAALPTTIGLAFATKLFVPYLGLLLLVGLASLWFGYFHRWTVLAWSTAFVLNSVFVLVTLLRRMEPIPAALGPLTVGALVVLLLGLIAVYFGSFVTRTLVRGRDTTVLEMGQTVTVLGIGFGGSFALIGEGTALHVVLGAAALVLALGCYAAAFAFIDRRLGRGRNFAFFGSLGLALLLLSCFVLLHGSVAGAVLALLAAAAAWMGGRWRRATLSLHGATYLIAAALASGTFGLTADAFLGPTVAPLGSIPVSHVLVLLAAAFCSTRFVSTEGAPWGRFAHGTRAIDFSVFFIAAAGIVVTGIGSVLPTDGGGVHRGALAASRAGILATSAVALAWVSRRPRFAEALYFVYPLLAACAVKILLEDFRIGHSLTLFTSLTFFGLALMAAPRLTRGAGLRAG
ncbi:MAG: hypothetical protein R3E97_15125 [Candidatus Eisenbacteria bacterium]